MALSPEYFFFYMADATGGAKGFQDGTDQMCSIPFLSLRQTRTTARHGQAL